MNSNGKQACVRQAVGVFYDEKSLKSTITDLLDSGFERTELALLASEQVVENSLGAFYGRTNADSDSQESPGIAFVSQDSLGETARAFGGGMFFIGAVFVMGALVLVAAFIGGALIAAIVGIGAVGAVGGVVAYISHQSDAEELKEQVDKGHILLFVKTENAGREREVKALLEKHNAVDIKIYNSPLKPHKEPEPQGISF